MDSDSIVALINSAIAHHRSSQYFCFPTDDFDSSIFFSTVRSFPFFIDINLYSSSSSPVQEICVSWDVSVARSYLVLESL